MARLVFIDSVPSLIASSRCRLILLVRNVVPPSHHSCLFEVVENCHLFSAVVNVSLQCVLHSMPSFPSELGQQLYIHFYLVYIEGFTSCQSKDRNSDSAM